MPYGPSAPVHEPLDDPSIAGANPFEHHAASTAGTEPIPLPQLSLGDRIGAGVGAITGVGPRIAGGLRRRRAGPVVGRSAGGVLRRRVTALALAAALVGTAVVVVAIVVAWATGSSRPQTGDARSHLPRPAPRASHSEHPAQGVQSNHRPVPARHRWAPSRRPARRLEHRHATRAAKPTPHQARAAPLTAAPATRPPVSSPTAPTTPPQPPRRRPEQPQPGPDEFTFEQ
jgi:hypothetical protein